MDFNDTPEEAAFRKEVRAWLDANATRKSDDKQSFRARNDDPFVGFHPEVLWAFWIHPRRSPPPVTCLDGLGDDVEIRQAARALGQ